MLKISRFLLAAAFWIPSLLLAQSSKPLADEYTFKLGITYEITNGKPGEAKNTTATTFWFSDKNYAGFEMPKRQGMLMVYDLANKQMLTFMADKKMVMVMDMAMMEQKMEAMKKEQAGKPKTDVNVKITKTGKTEKILGYTCEQYQLSSSSGNSLIWVTKELGTGFTSFADTFSQMMQSNPSGNGIPDMKGMGNGVMLKMETTSATSGATSTFEATSIQKEGRKITSSEYKLMAMPGY